MRVGPVLPLLLLAALASGQSPAKGDRLGKTNAEIVAMGWDRWSDLYHARHPDGTTGALAVFGEALAERNTNRIEKLPAADRNRLIARRASLQEYDRLIDLLGSLGGVMAWSDPDDPEVAVEREELFWEILRLQAKPPPRMNATSSERVWAAVRAALRTHDQHREELTHKPKEEYENFRANKGEVLRINEQAKALVWELGRTLSRARPDEGLLIATYLRARVGRVLVLAAEREADTEVPHSC